jgi:hypothetical protein
MDEQTGVEVTVYNGNLGLVKDARKIRLPNGEGELRFMDVASYIMPETVHVKTSNDPGGFSVFEQNYEHDLMSADKLLNKYVGKKIKIVDFNKFQDRKDVTDAVVLSNNEGRIFRIKDEIYSGHPGIKVLPKIPENLIAKPTLTWQFVNKSAHERDIEVSYLTKNINWKADYVVVLNKDDDAADISGWVTLDNRSGATYRQARLILCAGDLHRVRPLDDAYRRLRTAQEAYYNLMGVTAAAQFKPKTFFEYHVYYLQRKTTIKDNQTKQISLLDAAGVNVQMELLVHGFRNYFTRQCTELSSKQQAAVWLKFDNAEKNQLGKPLPAGIIRLYKNEEDGSRQFIGENRIDHTPKDEEVRLKICEAFDVVAERVQTDYRELAEGLHESEWEITLRNHKDKDVSVGVEEPLFGNWNVTSKSHEYVKKDAFTIRFDVNVPKDGEVKVKYRVRVGI